MAHRTLPVPAPALALAFAAALLPALPARAEGSPADAGDPLPLAVPADSALPYAALGVSVDLAGLFFARYGLRLEHAPSRVVGLWGSLAWGDVLSAEALSVQGGVHLWPLGGGLSGFFLGPSAALAVAKDVAPYAVVISGEAGYQAFLDGVTLSILSGVSRSEPLERGDGGGEPRGAWGVRFAVQLGYAWM